MVPKNSQSAQDAHGIGAYHYDPQNDMQEVGRHRSNHFDNSERRLITARFGEIKPFLDFDAVPKDNHVFSSKHELRSYTLKSPLFSNIKMDKRYFLVPMSSILPNAWREFFTNPIKGDDVPDDVYCRAPLPVYSITKSLMQFISTSGTNPVVQSFNFTSVKDFLDFFRLFFFLMKITSPDSLFSNLGCDTTNFLFRRSITSFSDTSSYKTRRIPNAIGYENLSLDEWFEKHNGFTGTVSSWSYNGSTYTDVHVTEFTADLTFTFDNNSFVKRVVYKFPDPSNVRQFINDILNPDIMIKPFSYQISGTLNDNTVVVNVNVSGSSDGSELESLAQVILPEDYWFYKAIGSGSGYSLTGNPPFLGYVEGLTTSGIQDTVNGQYWFNPNYSYDGSDSRTLDVDYSYLVAYQQICAQFYTVDAIDNVYSSEKWMKNMWSVFSAIVGDLTLTQRRAFEYNGYLIDYDLFSRNVLLFIYNEIPIVVKNSSYDRFYHFLYNLFMPQHSLAYGDYFLGGRLEPLAVGDVSIDVSGSSSSGYHVSALDTTRNLQLQRFLNKINRTGAQIQDYMRGIFGARPDYIEPQPLYLGGSSTMIGSYEVENTTSGTPNVTTEQQGYPVSLLRTQQDTNGFELDINGDNCVVLGLLSFDMMRIYKDTVNRQFFKDDRFDFFQPDLQNIGDQELYSAEIGSQKVDTSSLPTVNSVTYPFAYHLRDTHYKQRYPIACGAFCRNDILPSWSNVVSIVNNRYYVNDGLNSELIRNHPEDIDKFYQSLSGITDSSYFHFIICMDNNIQSNREMQYKPLIQG